MLNDFLENMMNVLKLQKRPETTDIVRYGQYTSDTRKLIYNDSKKQYEKFFSYPDDKEIKSVKAFALFIKEELRRRNNTAGDKATVKITLGGGSFIPDDDFGEFKTTFNRLNSQQWNLIKVNINKIMTHRSFLQFVQGLKPSIENFDDVYQRLATLRMIGSTTLVSNPIFTDNGQESGYKCTYRLEDGHEGEEVFPTGFVASVPFAKAGENHYEVPIEMLFFRDDSDELGIQILCPTFENIEEQAIIDEANYVKEQTSECSQLLVLSDF